MEQSTAFLQEQNRTLQWNSILPIFQMIVMGRSMENRQTVNLLVGNILAGIKRNWAQFEIE